MGIIDDVLKALDRIPGWKRINSLPEEFDLLKKRVEALELKLSGNSLEKCPVCGNRTFERTGSLPHPIFGKVGRLMLDSYRCSECSHQEQRERSVQSER